VRNLGLIVAFWLATMLPTSSLALGLGEIEVNSFLNQPLNAEIEVISARPGEIDDLLVSLASSEAFTRAGLSRPRHLSNLRFSVKKNEEGDEAVIIVSTKSAIKEPFLNFLIEADWSKGRVLREFTILLDPPFYANQPASAETIAEPVEQPASEEASVEEASVSEIVEQSGVTTSVDTSEPAESSESIIEPIALSEDTSSPAVPEPEPVSEEYVSDETRSVTQGDVSIVKGDTLWSIASRYKDDDHSMSQVMLAFQRANPNAFNDGNINNMKVGAVLRVPGAEELDAIGKQESYAEVLVQNGLWDEYVARVTGVSPAVASEDGGSEAVAQDGDAEAASGELSLLLPAEGESESTGTGDTGDVGTLRTKLALAEEELEASRIENQELESRISELQARLSKLEELQKMVEIEDDSLAQLQADQTQQSEQAEDMVELVEEQAATETVTEAIEADEEALLEELLAEEAEAQAQEQTVLDEAVTEQAATDETMTDDGMSDDGMSDDSMSEDTVTEETGTDGVAVQDAETDEVAPPPAPVIVTEPATRKPSIFDGLLPPAVVDMIPSMDSIIGDPIILAAVGGVILLLLILIFLKRRKGSSDEESAIIAGVEEDLFAGDDEDELTPIHLADGAEAEETDIRDPSAEDMVQEQPVEEPVAEVAAEPQEDVEPTAVIEAVDVPEAGVEASAASTAEQDDVLNEVDVYLAYGLYDNAEELLSNSITEHPERADYRSKLLDTYFATKNSEGFIKEAENLKSMGDSAAGYWNRVQIMGYELAPDNALFSDAKDSDLSAADLEISKPQEADFDLGSADDDTTNFSTTDFNLGEDDTGGDFSDTESMGEAGQIASTQVIPKLDELPDFDDENDTNLRAEPEAEVGLELPDDVGEELEFSMDDGAGQESAEPAAAEAADPDDMAMEFDIGEGEAAADDISEVDFGTEFEEAIEQADELDLDESASAEVEVDDDAVELDAASLDEEGHTGTAIITPNYEDTEVVPDLKSSADEKDDEAIDLGMDDTGIIDLDETSFETAELNLETAEVRLETAELNLDTGELDLSDDEEGDDDEDISIIDFGGEDFVEPTDIIESIDEADDSAMMDVDIDEDDDVKTGTFAPGDFEEPTAAVDSLDDIDDLMLPDDVDEVSTKLDLARAFIDMGDNEGARGSLEEVIAEGNEDQKAEAKSLLDQI
jgi:pilus assembly protein FimV